MRLGQVNVILLFSVSALSILGFTNAYAHTPNIDTFVADDPDNGDLVYSVGDTFTLTFSAPINVTASATMSQGAIDGNFTLSGGAVFGTTYSGLWSADRLSLTITVNTVGAPNPTIGATTVSAAGGSNLGHAGDPPTPATLTGAPVLAGDYGVAAGGGGGGGSGPSGGYERPTMGVTKHGLVLVDNGFSYNNNPVDVSLMNTHYPLVTTNVGQENVAKLKIHSPRGIDKIQHVGLGFGLGKGQIFGDSKVVIEWDKLWDGKETLNVVDPENYLDNVRVVTSDGLCRENANDICLIVEFFHTFRKPLDYNIIGTYVWDNKRSASNNYYNDGIQVIGKSLDPPSTYQVLHNGKLIQITETGKNTAVDENGNTWTFDKSWEMNNVSTGKIDKGLTSKWYERNHLQFDSYKTGQAILAQNILESSPDGKLIKSKLVHESTFIDGDYIKRNNNFDLQNRIKSELIKANQYFDSSYVIDEYDELAKYWNIYKQFQSQHSN